MSKDAEIRLRDGASLYVDDYDFCISQLMQAKHEWFVLVDTTGAFVRADNVLFVLPIEDE